MEQILVDLNKALEVIEDCNSDGLTGIFCSYQDGKRFEQRIKQLPIVEPIKGEWIPLNKGKIFKVADVKCSVCGNTLDFMGVNCGRGDANFCPNCGADMRGGKE